MGGLIWLEDELTFAGWNALAVVSDDGVDPWSVPAHVDSDLVASVSLCVGEEIAQNLPDPLGVGQRQVSLAADRRRGIEDPDCRSRFLLHVHWLLGNSHAGDVASGGDKEVFDDCGELIRLVDDHRMQIAEFVLCEVERAVPNLAGDAGDHSQRRSEFVRYRGKEAVFLD